MDDLKQVVDWDGLVYYDSKIKNYIEEKIDAVKDHVDENEAAILVLQADDKRIDSRIDSLSLEVRENTTNITNIIEQLKYIPSIDFDSYATKEFVEQKIEEAQLSGGDIDLSNYYSKDEVDDLVEDIGSDISVVSTAIATLSESVERIEQSIPTKVSELENDANYLTEHQSLAGYATETYVQEKIQEAQLSGGDVDLSNYYTKEQTNEAITEAIQGIEIPVIDLSPYATKEQVAEQVSLKANNVLFVEDYVVTTPLGQFSQNESVKDLTISEIITRLLGLQKAVTPDAPEGSSEVVKNIIDNELPIYSQTSEGELSATPFDHVIWTVEEAAKEHDGENDFYQIVDANGNVIESGYHETTVYNEVAYLTIALPSSVTSVTPKMWDPDSNNFVEMTWILTPVEGSTIDGYTLWTVPEQYEILSGDTYRFVINN